MKPIKQLAGRGNLSSADASIAVDYELTVWHDARTNSRWADGRLISDELLPHQVDFMKVPPPKLTLSNGDQVEVVLRHVNASGGTFGVNGPVPGTSY
ncbi:hypothetical protein [Aurantimonas endophytica]|uniref:Uncharacterized protein n=1 Tax=Aurantimonas endophytica TaxID=1522175 RepID=A0A7W6HAM4_9HYPH|nr:hypothetical protein [Aurantimonas endophytica]MBB4001628.1 hypothetical protein [Aurantimonas endophytica]MCO6402735.1 hypothetical protein [Aurantimonas endophytica]